MNKKIKIIIIGIITIILFLGVDLISIFTINRPLFAIKDKNVYKGLFYDTYNCPEYSVPQIKTKVTKFTCAVGEIKLDKVKEIVDTTEEIKDFACAEALESFYEDDNYIYYWSCIKNKYMVVRYDNGYEEEISMALKNQTITISDLDRFNIDYIKEEKESE